MSSQLLQRESRADNDDALLLSDPAAPTDFPALPGKPGRGLAWAAVTLAVIIAIASLILALTSGASQIEETLEDRVESRLAEAGVTDLEVSANGRDITLTGPQARKSEAFAGETDGVRSVSVVTTETDPASDSDPVTEEPVEASATELRLATGADTIVLEGVVPDEAARELVAQAAGTTFSRVEDRLEVGSDDADWTPGLMDVLGELSRVTNGSLVLADDVITLDGAVVDSVTRMEVSEAFASAAPNLRLVNNLRIDPEATASVPLTDEQVAMAEALAAPQRQISALLERANTGPAMFETDSPLLSPAGAAVIDDIAEVLAVALDEAPVAIATIGGHTDSTGSREYNQDLSQRRANAVLRRLVAQDIPTRRLEAIGHGPDEPVATNDSPAGRAQNRRITVDLQLPEPG